MKKPEIKFIKTHPEAQLPTKNHGNRSVTDDEINRIAQAQNDYLTEMAIKTGQSVQNLKARMNLQQNYYNEETNEVYGTCDSGYDIFACEDTLIPANGRAVVPTGVKVGYINPGFWFRIEARSGLGFKHGLAPHPGIIDNQYRGDTGICMYNHSSVDYQIKKGDRIAQIVIYPVIDVSMSWTEEVDNTDRGEKGFGSSGK